MSLSSDTAWIIDTASLESQLHDKDILVVDMTNKESYFQAHIPGAVFLDYANVVKHQPPVFGLLPDPAQFSQALGSIGITPDTYVVAYDDEGGGKASRLLWTLEVAGHKKMSLLDGGIHAWLNDNKAVNSNSPETTQTHYPLKFDNTSPLADADYILQNLGKNDVCILDTRSKNEFIGADVRSARAGHIPGAIHLDWLDIKDPDNAQRLKPANEIKKMLSDSGISNTQEIITHCHSHHRSALMYVALKHLGFKQVKGYPASWSDWAARNDTPVET